MKSTANRTRPKMMSAGIVGLVEAEGERFVALADLIMKVSIALFKRSIVRHCSNAPALRPSNARR
jgi:hypothetical protein